jgi:hypothetical protein
MIGNNEFKDSPSSQRITAPIDAPRLIAKMELNIHQSPAE